MNNLSHIGLGNPEARLKVYIANRPPLNEYLSLDACHYLVAGEVKRIADETGNHWRKIFNVYAKLLHKLDHNGFADWRNLRDEQLLQHGCDHALLFSAPQPEDNSSIHLVMAKGYAEQLPLNNLVWLDNDFGWNPAEKLIVCPYFDYRQLSDVKIERLVKLLDRLE